MIIKSHKSVLVTIFHSSEWHARLLSLIVAHPWLYWINLKLEFGDTVSEQMASLPPLSFQLPKALHSPPTLKPSVTRVSDVVMLLLSGWVLIPFPSVCAGCLLWPLHTNLPVLQTVICMSLCAANDLRARDGAALEWLPFLMETPRRPGAGSSSPHLKRFLSFPPREIPRPAVLHPDEPMLMDLIKAQKNKAVSVSHWWWVIGKMFQNHLGWCVNKSSRWTKLVEWTTTELDLNKDKN